MARLFKQNFPRVMLVDMFSLFSLSSSPLAPSVKNFRPPPLDVSNNNTLQEEQYRMDPDICAFPSEKFYEGKLRNASRFARESFILLDWIGLFWVVWVMCCVVYLVYNVSSEKKFFTTRTIIRLI
jgi:hypothetical protein